MVTGAKIRPDLGLRQKAMWDPGPWGSPNVPHSTAVSRSGRLLRAPGVFVVPKLPGQKPHVGHGRQWHLRSCLTTFVRSRLPVELAGHLRFCRHHLRRQERTGKLQLKILRRPFNSFLIFFKCLSVLGLFSYRKTWFPFEQRLIMSNLKNSVMGLISALCLNSRKVFFCKILIP